jgi:GT2 family glycosyltransferase
LCSIKITIPGNLDCCHGDNYAATVTAKTAATIVIPTRDRPGYLEVALRSIAPQARAAGAEMIVVDDAGGTPAVGALVGRFGARYVAQPRPLGLNVARNTGVEHASGELVVFVDDDVEVAPGWLAALLEASHRYPRAAVFTGPIRARLEGRPPRSCGREKPPLTTLELGAQDRETAYAWGANMAIRRAALERVGRFDATIADGGDEQEWQDRLAASYGQPAAAIYVAGAALDHRRSGPDTRLGALARTAHARGRAARRFDVRSGTAPAARSELLTLAGCAGHVLRRRCLGGLVMVSHSAGRLRELAAERAAGAASAPPSASATPDGRSPQPDFLSGASGTVGGLDGLRRGALDLLDDARELTSGRRRRLQEAARRLPPTRNVLVLGVVRPERSALAGAIRAELLRSRHHVEIHTRHPDGLGKFENLNLLLTEHPPAGHDWLIVVDDDISLPAHFLDRFLLLAESFSLDMAQPAHRRRSHAAWAVTRRAPGSALRETSFVEIGPLTALGPRTWPALLPFPPLRMGWGLDLHWAALARDRGWRLGVLDAVPIAHLAAPAADSYPREQALAEARSFLAQRPYLTASEAQRTLTTHRSFS